MPDKKSRYFEFWWNTVRKTLRSVMVGAGMSFSALPTAGGIGIPPLGFSLGSPPAVTTPKAVSKANATSESSFDLPVPGGPEIRTFRERARSFKACLHSSLAIAVSARVDEVSIPDHRLIHRAFGVHAVQKLLGNHGVPSKRCPQGPFFCVVRPHRAVIQLD